MKDKIIELLKETSRTGIINLIDAMEEGGFFEAPCSTDKHLCREIEIGRASCRERV